ncbi:LysR substrate-binding domain-containing protein [Amphritea balenae]|uniref:LysR family transcriptional regulator n=1 Tax=Amphritea balenae TaxID=452629 RepID=A0A3P1SWD9_9GAMM|nr:LysR substrate-binding domain-containing protein [Amphritea balenae]RRD00433.1 LysR family transcriptional regulator [Amphritea balenae]GGK70859.1 LysR family transcriptional regulator [Amphritea balenae]
MVGFKKKLPPLSTLVTFEAAARLLSFTQAGEELHVTQTAISRQVRSLEEYLSRPLFIRGHRSVKLTDAGELLLQSVSMGLEHIATTVTELRYAKPESHLTVSATIAFASLWLSPRLLAFKQLHPNLEVRILASDRDINLQTEGVDLAFGCGDYDNQSGVKATFLFADEVFPVCSSNYLNTRAQINKPEDLLQHQLLHLDDEHWRNISWKATDWSLWLKSQDVKGPLPSGGLRINNYPLLLQTAVNGQGIALGWKHLVSDLLKQGLLIKPLQQSLNTHRGYYLVESSQAPLSIEAKTFRDWILQQAQNEQG